MHDANFQQDKVFAQLHNILKMTQVDLLMSCKLLLQSELAIDWSRKLQEAAVLYPRGSWLQSQQETTFDWTTLPLTW